MITKKFATVHTSSNLTDAHLYEFEDISYDLEGVTQFPLVEKPGLERYLPLLPIESLHVSLHGREGGTPLFQMNHIGHHYGLPNLWVKDEGKNPNGNFKDRESAVLVSWALESGIDQLNICSSGNAALSTSSYARVAGIPINCFIPTKTSPEKKHQIALVANQLVEVEGFYEDVYRHLAGLDIPGYNATTGMSEIRLEGDTTIAYEIWEEKGVPDVIVVPSGNGGCLAGIWKGFKNLQALGKIQTMPQMVAVQIEGAAPIKTALEQGMPFVKLGDIDDSVAEGIIAQESYCSPKAVQALIESRGYVATVSDAEIKQALQLTVFKEAFWPEPTSAAAFAAIPKLVAEKSANIVVINTGTGLRYIPEIEKIINGKH